MTSVKVPPVSTPTTAAGTGAAIRYSSFLLN
jgi:hypothetical protein